jgi:hypothetical protein
MNIEDRIFELSGKLALSIEIAAIIVDEYGIALEEARDLVLKVRLERKTPQLVSARRAIDRLYQLSYY